MARRALGDLLRPDGLRTSILGPAWSRDLDVHVTTLPDPERLVGLGWVRLDGLLERLGHPGGGRWAVIEDQTVLGLADLTTDVLPDRVRAVLDRCRRRKEVRVREVLELRALVRSEAHLPPRHPVLAAAARIEAGLGGDLLAEWRDGPALPPPTPLPVTGLGRIWSRVRPFVARLRPRARIIVGISGIDGAGKSTLVSRLAGDLERVGLPVTRVWTRPGMGLQRLSGVAEVAKRLLRQESAPGVQRIGGGEPPASMASRRGVVGWIWSFLVVLSFVRKARRERRRGRGILLYDRHLLDALVTLDVVYEGVRLDLQRGLVRRLLPRADLTLLLTVAPATASARKPADMFTEAVLDRQARRYAALRPVAPNLRELEGTRPPGELAEEAFRLVAQISSRRLRG